MLSGLIPVIGLTPSQKLDRGELELSCLLTPPDPSLKTRPFRAGNSVPPAARFGPLAQ